MTQEPRQTVDACLAAAVSSLGAAGIDLPALEARMLMARAIGASRSGLYLLGDRPLSAQETDRFSALIAERCGGRPVAYLCGAREFYGLSFEVSDAVLIPRPETELLVDCALEYAGAGPPLTVVDAGTGSGCVAVAVAARRADALLVAVDVSDAALAVAARNASRHGVGDRVRVVRTDMLSALRRGSVDLVLSNPPYIATEEMAALALEVRDHEPRLALDGGADGLALHRRVARGAAGVLRPGGRLAVEVAIGQAERVVAVHAASGLRHERVVRDLAGIDRVVISRRPSSRSEIA